MLHQSHARTFRLLSLFVGITGFSVLGYYFTLSSHRIYPIESILWLSSTEEAVPLEPIPKPSDDSHPIIPLLQKAEADFNQLLGRETHDIASGAWAYREKRGRHPPPGFDKWYKYALDNDAIIIEEFWDQIYHDLNPLWALDQKKMREEIRSQKEIIQVRKGRVTCNSDHFWAKIWKELVTSIAPDIPDIDIAINIMDEPRLLIPWEEMNGYVETEKHNRKILPVHQVMSKYSSISESDSEKVPYDDSHWNRKWPVFERARLSCPPNSPARTAPLQTEFSNQPVLSTEFMNPHMQGYVSNYTLATSICHQPDLQGLHGFFIEPISIKTSDQLFPYFGGSKLTVNSEILLPAAMYYEGDSRFSSKAPVRPWNKKTDTLLWRGLASGGRNKEDNWKGFHRHRLVSMLNGTQALLMPNNSGFIDVQDLPLEMWELGAWTISSGTRNEAIGEWLNKFSHVGFTGLACFPAQRGNEGCAYTDYLFATMPRVDLIGQHEHKYLVDVDGNSFSGRYRDFLLSGSLPIKATLFKEWHDARLVAWKHFVPFDNRFLDLYGIMEFFLGYGKGTGRKQGRDQLARRIAKEGHEWATKVLRKEDMRIYTYRLLLEYARVMDENRETLGWVDDLTS